MTAVPLFMEIDFILFQQRRQICNLAFGDLPRILQQDAFAVNKFDTKLDQTVVDCLRYWVYEI